MRKNQRSVPAAAANPAAWRQGSLKQAEGPNDEVFALMAVE
jgi:hypothetical protein